MKIPMITLMTDSSLCADDISSHDADDNTQPIKVSHVQSPTVGEKNHVDHNDNTLCKMVTDQHMYHTTKTARNYCCRKQQTCHVKTT